MSTMRILVAVCATVLIAAGLGSEFAHAGIKGLFFSQKSYAILADHLYKATQSDELADNTKAAATLLSEQPDGKQDLIELVQAFSSLAGVSSDPEIFCGKDNLANLLRVAEGIRDGGNLGPRKIKDAISRLNKIVVKVIDDAREVCDPYLTGKWPEPWQPNFNDWYTKPRIENLNEIAPSYLYEGYVGAAENPSSERDWQIRTISTAIVKSEWQEDPDGIRSTLTEDRNAINNQLVEYVYIPCSEFVRLDEASKVLVPFNALIKSWSVVSTGLLNDYYANKDAYRPRNRDEDSDKNQVRVLAHIYRACERFLVTPSEDLAKKIGRYRKREGRE